MYYKIAQYFVVVYVSICIIIYYSVHNYFYQKFYLVFVLNTDVISNVFRIFLCLIIIIYNLCITL